MSNIPESIFKVLDAKNEILFSIILTCLIFCLLVFQQSFREFFDTIHSEALSYSFLILILVALLSLSRLCIRFFNFLLNLKKSFLAQKYHPSVDLNIQDQVLSHFKSKDFFGGEIMILVQKKSQDQKNFILNETEYSIRLENKGLIKKLNVIYGNDYQYEIPDFVWKSTELDKFVAQFDCDKVNLEKLPNSSGKRI